jgi:hypothetical protein
MNSGQVLRSLGTLLFLCLFISVVVSAMVFFFVFIINQEDWFFGMKLDGPMAGLYLFAKGLGAAAIAVILAQFPRFQKAGAIAGIGYFGLMFFDSAVTIQKNTYGRESFSLLLALLLLVPVLLLITQLLIPSPGQTEDEKHHTIP